MRQAKMQNLKPLPASFYSRDTKIVARDLLGKFLVRASPEGKITGKIVETEAYYGVGDPASHSYRGKTKRSSVMWGPPGMAYVYFTYGMHYLLNVVTEKEGTPGAVLIRACEPLEGIKIMVKNRGREKIAELTSGPAKLTQAFGIDGSFNRYDLTGGELFIAEGQGKTPQIEVEATGRVGIRKGTKRELRFLIRGSKFVSGGKYSLNPVVMNSRFRK